MIADFLDYYKSDKFDKNIIIKHLDKSYSVGEIKKLVCSQARYLKALNFKKVVLDFENNFDFIIGLQACVFARKDIYVVNSNNGVFNIENSFVYNKLSENVCDDKVCFDNINPDEINIFIHTSGSTKEPKVIQKSLSNYIKESEDLKNTFEFKSDLEFVTTTTLKHLFGQTFYLFLPLNNGNVINTTTINYPEDVNVKNSVLVTTPSFLSVMKKYDYSPTFRPIKIISAGAKLEDSVFEYANSLTEQTIDIYGSSETGVIAYRCTPKDDRKLFDGINIVANSESVTVIASDYSINKTDELQDRIEEQSDRKIKLLGRSDKVFKIQEKRVSAIEIEEKISSLKYVKECYCTVKNDKLASLTALTLEGMNRFVEMGYVEFVKELKLFLSKDFKIIPQYWTFVDEIPKTQSAKVDKAAIEKIFNINLSLPLVIDRNITKDSAEFEIYFYKNCNFFKGHFDGCPITPGVVQLYYAAYFSQVAFGKDFHVGQIKKIKFKNIIYPDTKVYLRIKLKSENADYEFFDETKSYSSGSLPAVNRLA